MSGVTFYREQDADPAALRGTCVAVVGYGNLGRSMALNLRDSGVEVVVGNIDDDYRRRAVDDGFEVLDIADAVTAPCLIYLLIPDEAVPACFAADIRPHLRPGAAVVVASGYVLAYGLIEIPDFIDVMMLAPRMLGEEVRRSYLDGSGFFGYVSVEQDASGEATRRVLALAHGAGCLRKGAMPLSARNEALLDLLIEQTVGPYLGTAIQMAFMLGVGAGLPAEAMVLEMYMSGEMARTFQAFAEVGFMESVGWHGAVAQYGGFIRTLEVDREAMHRMFTAVLEDLRSGGFARRFQEEHAAGHPTLEAINAVKAAGSLMTEAERRVRAALAS
ncbi:MAG: ketol-acid reductoisomerase [Acidimicrobiia bacterium]|nr:ketol-acid reductoisomerase [Acidimicrobiia bacterium]